LNKTYKTTAMATKKILKAVGFLWVMLLFVTTGCKKEYDLDKLDDDVYLTPKLYIPVYSTTQTMEDVFKYIDSEVQLYSDSVTNLLYLVYSDNLVSLRADEVLDFTSQFEENNIEAGVDIHPSRLPFVTDTIGPLFLYDEMVFNYSEDDQMLDSILLDEITVHYEITSTFDHYTELVIDFPEILVNGNVYRKKFNFGPISEGGNVVDETETVENVWIKFDNTTKTDTSIFNFLYRFTAIKNSNASNPNQLETGKEQDIKITFSDVDFHKAYGYVGQRTLMPNQKDSVPINVFDSEYEGRVQFFSPVLQFQINNSYGLPLNVSLQDVLTSSLKMVTQPEQQIFFSDGQSKVDSTGFLVGSPPAAGLENDTVVEINNANSFESLKIAINTNPHKISFMAGGQANPFGKVPGKQNFVIDSSLFDVQMNLILPMHILTDAYILRDTIEFDFQSFANNYMDHITELKVMLESRNGLPADVFGQVKFLDSAYNVIDSLFGDPTKQPNVPAGVYNIVDDKVTEPSHQVDIGIIKNPAQTFIPVKHVMIQSIMRTYESNSNTFVKFFSTDALSLKLGIGAEVEYQGSLEDLSQTEE